VFVSRSVYYTVSQAEHVGRYCSSDSLQPFPWRTFTALTKLKQNCGSRVLQTRDILGHAALKGSGAAIKPQQFLGLSLFSVQRSSIYCKISAQYGLVGMGEGGRG
jgi:hypothetical protein